MSNRIIIPLHRMLGFARHEPGLPLTRQVGLALRPLLAVALSTTGLYENAAPDDAALAPSTDEPAAPAQPADPEMLFTAVSSLIEVVKSLTPETGRMFAHLGHEALPGGARCEDTGSALAPRSEVVIELVSVGAASGWEPADDPDRAADAGGALPFELAVVGAVVESSGGQLSLESDGGHSRTFVVRLPVHRSA